MSINIIENVVGGKFMNISNYLYQICWSMNNSNYIKSFYKTNSKDKLADPLSITPHFQYIGCPISAR